MSIYSIVYVISIGFLLPEFLFNKKAGPSNLSWRAILIDSKFEMGDNAKCYKIRIIEF